MRPFLHKQRQVRIGPLAVSMSFPQWQQMQTPGMQPYWMNIGTGQITNVNPAVTNTTGSNYNVYTPSMNTRKLGSGLEIPTKLKYSEQVDPIVAYKRAQLIVTDDGFTLYGVGNNAAYKPEDKAQCLTNRTWEEKPEDDEHRAPEEGCTCGFYAMDKHYLNLISAEYPRACADLEVELYGKVIKHEKGYRAEYQRVLGMYIDPVCKFCHRQGNILVLGRQHQMTVRCAICAEKDIMYPLSDISNQLGIEVRWGNL